MAAMILYSIGSHAQKSDVYNFPIKPGTEEWSKLKSYDERLNAYNVPENILKEMSTDGLIETCLNYPEFRLVMTRNSIQEGYNHVKSKFNGFRELENRPDAGVKLLDKYKQLDPSKIKTFETDLDKGIKLNTGERANQQIDKMLMSKDDLQRIVSVGKEYFR